jgi:hypothetical protein
MEYLLQSLSGAPYEKIKGLGIQGDKYEDALHILQEHYGNPTTRTEEAVKALVHLPKIKDNWSNLGDYINKLQCIVTSLTRSEVPREAININVALLFEVLPHNLQVEIQKMRRMDHEEKESWEMERFIHYLNDVSYIYRPESNKGKQESTKQSDKARESSNIDRYLHPRWE